MFDRHFVIGDVHGCSKTLRNLLLNVCDITSSDHLIFIGDLIDRGPDSRDVMDFVLELKDNSNDISIVRGNHEQMLLDSLNDSKAMKNWFRNGGKNTLDSFEVYHPGFIDDKYLELIFDSKHYIMNDNFIIVHAGLDFSVSNPLKATPKMRTIRSDKYSPEPIGARRLIVGHTPYSIEKVKLSLNENIIKLDAGCVYHKKVQGLGYLACYELESRELYFHQNIDFD
ncbi:MAG: metallophosphoesterase family protein [Candidatus Kapaibacterium sp.]